jgi:hypothetical protein
MESPAGFPSRMSYPLNHLQQVISWCPLHESLHVVSSRVSNPGDPLKGCLFGDPSRGSSQGDHSRGSHTGFSLYRDRCRGSPPGTSTSVSYMGSRPSGLIRRVGSRGSTPFGPLQVVPSMGPLQWLPSWVPSRGFDRGLPCRCSVPRGPIVGVPCRGSHLGCPIQVFVSGGPFGVQFTGAHSGCHFSRPLKRVPIICSIEMVPPVAPLQGVPSSRSSNGSLAGAIQVVPFCMSFLECPFQISPPRGPPVFSCIESPPGGPLQWNSSKLSTPGGPKIGGRQGGPFDGVPTKVSLTDSPLQLDPSRVLPQGFRCSGFPPAGPNQVVLCMGCSEVPFQRSARWGQFQADPYTRPH